jgi:hypothetical protein
VGVAWAGVGGGALCSCAVGGTGLPLIGACRWARLAPISLTDDFNEAEAAVFVCCFLGVGVTARFLLPVPFCLWYGLLLLLLLLWLPLRIGFGVMVAALNTPAVAVDMTEPATFPSVRLYAGGIAVVVHDDVAEAADTDADADADGVVRLFRR